LLLNLGINLPHFINLLDYSAISQGEGYERSAKYPNSNFVSEGLAAILAPFLFTILAPLISHGVDRSRKVGGNAALCILLAWSCMLADGWIALIGIDGWPPEVIAATTIVARGTPPSRVA
jgi:hypothetical protein